MLLPVPTTIQSATQNSKKKEYVSTKQISRKTLYIGFDAEWFTRKVIEFHDDQKSKTHKYFRKILSIQAYGVLKEEGKEFCPSCKTVPKKAFHRPDLARKKDKDIFHKIRAASFFL